MLNIKKYNFFCLLIVASMFGCKKDFLQKDPQGVTVVENFYKSNGDMLSAVNAAYDPAAWETDRAGSIYALPFFFGDVVSDDAIKGGENDADMPNHHAFETFTGNAGFPEILLPWQRFYTGIYRSNLVLENAPKSEADQKIKDQVMGEAYFLRAYYHFELIKMYGNVPIVTKVLSPDEYTLSRSPKSEVYAQIESDLSQAAILLPIKGSIEAGRATKGAATALLAKAQMYQTVADPSKWNGVLANAEKVINQTVGTYSLEPNYADIHTVAKENGVESIFEIQRTQKLAGNGGTNNSNWATGNEGTFLNVILRGRQNGGWGFNVPTTDLLNEFLKDTTVTGGEDPRLKATIIRDGDKLFGNTETYDCSYPSTKLYSRKYIEPSTATGLNGSDGPSNPRIIRYADILLMAAEAANEIGGNSAKALGYLNQVRDRANMPHITETDQDLLRDIIWRERRIELAFENHRFFDLVRQDRAYAVMHATTDGASFVEGKHEVFPIPISEIDLSQGKITQNLGY